MNIAKKFTVATLLLGTLSGCATMEHCAEQRQALPKDNTSETHVGGNGLGAVVVTLGAMAVGAGQCALQSNTSEQAPAL